MIGSINYGPSITDATQQRKGMNPQTPNLNVDESQRHYAKAESRGESFILYDVFPIYIKFYKR